MSQHRFVSAQSLPLFMVIGILIALFVLFRMKLVELNYKVAEVNVALEKVMEDNKALKAQKAQLLSVTNLRRWAVKHNLHQPRQDQIIIIP